MSQKKLSSEVLTLLQREFDQGKINDVVNLLREDNREKYGRNATRDINSISSLHNYMSKVGQISTQEGKEDYSKLLSALDSADEVELTKEVRAMIEKRTEERRYINMRPASDGNHGFVTPQKRPASLSVQPSDMNHRPLSSQSSGDSCSMLSPDGAVLAGAQAKRTMYQSRSENSANSVFSDDGNGFVDSGMYYLSNKSDTIYMWEETGPQKGLVAIINNFTKEADRDLYRGGTKEDEQMLRELFGNNVRLSQYYDVDDAHNDLAHDAFLLYLDQLAMKLRSGAYNSFLLFILSHGEKEGVKSYYNDPKVTSNNVIPVDDITDKFADVLIGRPKLFFIQACQGVRDNTPEEMEADDASGYPSQPFDDENIEDVEADLTPTVSPPRGADMLTALATIKGYRSYRAKKKGTWFIRLLVEVIKESLREHLYSTHLLDILTEVSRRVAEKEGHTNPSIDSVSSVKAPKILENGKVKVKQMPYFQTTLRKKFYFRPPDLPF